MLAWHYNCIPCIIVLWVTLAKHAALLCLGLFLLPHDHQSHHFPTSLSLVNANAGLQVCKLASSVHSQQGYACKAVCAYIASVVYVT